MDPRGPLDPDQHSGLLRLDSLPPGPDSVRILRETVWRAPHRLWRHKALAMYPAVGGPGELRALSSFGASRELPLPLRFHALDSLALLAEACRDAGWSRKELTKDLAAAFKDPDPQIARGIVVTLGRIPGPESLEALLGLALAPGGGMVRPDIYREALVRAGDGLDLEGFLAAPRARSASLRRFLEGMSLEPVAVYRYKVYPSDDYLALRARELGIGYSLFKHLMRPGALGWQG